MDISSAPGFSEAGRARSPAGALAADRGASASAVSWAAVFAGAAAAAALSLVLLILGTGLGLSAVSPWAQAGASAVAIGVSTIVWITVTQVLASGMGGYLAGRLRTRWHGTPTDEVFFRDTAHGFLAWAVATLLTAALLTSAIGSIVGSGVQAGATVASAAGAAGAAGAVGAAGSMASGATRADAAGGMGANPLTYFVDTLFRPDSRGTSTSATTGSATIAAAPAAAGTATTPASPADAATAGSAGVAATGTARPATEPMSASASAAEVTRILANSMRAGSLPAEDLHYVGQIVAQRTGLSQAEADKRVTDTFARWQGKLREAETAARDAADTVRKASAASALWLFVSLLVGAFVASFAATFGGRQRDT